MVAGWRPASIRTVKLLQVEHDAAAATRDQVSAHLPNDVEDAHARYPEMPRLTRIEPECPRIRAKAIVGGQHLEVGERLAEE